MTLLLSSSPKPPHLLLGLILLLVTPIATTADSLTQICSSREANYTTKSTYQSNLNRLLSSLTANGSATGFLNVTAGDVPEAVYGLVLCRGDVETGVCRSCLDTAAQDVLQICTNKKSAVIWYDYCMLRYSDRWFFSVPDDTLKVPMWNVQNLTEVIQFNKQLDLLMKGLVRYAAYNRSALMFATGAADYGQPATPKIYGLVQCTRDQSADDCSTCLNGIIGEMPSWAFGKMGFRYLKATCNIRYELYPFYNSSVMVSVPLPTDATPPAAALQPPTYAASAQGKKHSTGTVLAIALPSVAAFVMISVICVCFRRRMSKDRELCKLLLLK